MFVFVFVFVITVVSVFVLVFVITFVFVFDSATIFVVTQVCFPTRTSRDETRASQLGRQLERWLLHSYDIQNQVLIFLIMIFKIKFSYF